MVERDRPHILVCVYVKYLLCDEADTAILAVRSSKLFWHPLFPHFCMLVCISDVINEYL